MKNKEMENKQYIDVQVVKTLMREKGIDEKKMAELTNFSPAALKRFLSGANQARLNADWLLKIAKALSVRIPEIIHKDYH